MFAPRGAVAMLNSMRTGPPPSTALHRAWIFVALRGVLAIVVASVVLTRPGMSREPLLAILGGYLFIDGLLALGIALRAERGAAGRGRYILEGLVSLTVGALAFAHPTALAAAVFTLIAARSIIAGLVEIASAISLRRTGAARITGRSGSAAWCRSASARSCSRARPPGRSSCCCWRASTSRLRADPDRRRVSPVRAERAAARDTPDRRPGRRARKSESSSAAHISSSVSGGRRDALMSRRRHARHSPPPVFHFFPSIGPRHEHRPIAAHPRTPPTELKSLTRNGGLVAARERARWDPRRDVGLVRLNMDALSQVTRRR